MPLIVPLITQFMAEVAKLQPDERMRRINRVLEALSDDDADPDRRSWPNIWVLESARPWPRHRLRSGIISWRPADAAFGAPFAFQPVRCQSSRDRECDHNCKLVARDVE
jgi:hypothetical protein